jgi:ADP-ribose pyrophosphatase YjhB (NUDIX family)
MIVTADNCTFVPKRSRKAFERPETLQASVGGAVAVGEHPTQALVREIREEWGVLADKDDVRYFALVINRRTAEPDLIALVTLDSDADHVCRALKDSSEKQEFTRCVPLDLSHANLASLVSLLRNGDWSQPSDQAAFLLTLVRTLGFKSVENAARRARPAR